MKKIVRKVALAIFALLSILFGVSTFVYYNKYNDTLVELNKTKKELDNLKDGLKNNSFGEVKENNTSSSNENENNSQETAQVPEVSEDVNKVEQEYDKLFPISVTELQEYLNKKENFILLVSQSTCGSCISYKPVFNETLGKYNLKAYVIEYNLLSDNDKKVIDDNFNVLFTPTTIFINKGVEDHENRIDGIASENYIVNKLKATKFIS